MKAKDKFGRKKISIRKKETCRGHDGKKDIFIWEFQSSVHKRLENV